MLSRLRITFEQDLLYFILALWHLLVFSRLSHSEFIIPYSKFMRSFSQPFSAGMRFKMRYENEDATERRSVFCNSTTDH
jgi:hypothetical protein